MKKFLSVFLILVVLFSNINMKISNAYKNDMQGAWITTVYNMDWPKNRDSVEVQKQEMINLLDTLKSTGINTVMFQVRTQGDALYNSNINPWSSVLTGIQGKNPGYDPLEFIIQEAHKRNIEVHAWLNPYRVTTSGVDLNKLSENHQARKNPDWVLSYNDKLYFNPELEEVKKHIVETVSEIVLNYDVDGIHFDDYFYPANYPLPEGETRDGKVANERRNHITDMVSRVSKKIEELNSDVEFGISPAGIWKNKNSDINGSNTNGRESFYADYADARLWIKEELIDYVVPQIYWETGHELADYETLVSWWNNSVDGTDVDLYVGHGIYKDEISKEIDKQLEIEKKYENADGSVYYTTRDILNNKQGVRDKIKNFNEQNPSLTDIKNHWAEESIRFFVDNNYVDGYEDNTFKPNNKITRAEFVKLINKVNNLSSASGKVFDDTKNHWAKYEIDVAYTNGVAKGKSDNLFKPNDYITRQEAATMIANVMKISDSNFDKIDNYSDGSKVSSWAKPSVEAMIENKILSGYSDNTIRPLNNLTRAEAVVMLMRTLND